MYDTFYPAIFHTAEEGGFWATFPDFPECFTDGDSTSEIYSRAVDALGLAITSRIQENEELPQPTFIDKIDPCEGTIAIIAFSLVDYQKRSCAS
ncbi:MAG: type II toxin-antitoxin system HicB family antitoxin [Clostridiales bacterium]|nr:type II toxin-antitoxin system HicB family antitoxin [Clostridiales bacterium]